MSCFGKLKSDSGNTTFSWRPARITAFVSSSTRALFVKYLSGRKLFAGNVAGWTEKRIYCLIRFCVVTAALEIVLNLREFVNVFLLFVYFLTYNQIFNKQNGMLFYFQNTVQLWWTALTQWLRGCATNRKVAGSIQTVSLEFFIHIKSFRSHYGPGVDTASNRNEYQEHFLGLKSAVA